MLGGEGGKAKGKMDKAQTHRWVLLPKIWFYCLIVSALSCPVDAKYNKFANHSSSFGGKAPLWLPPPPPPAVPAVSVTNKHYQTSCQTSHNTSGGTPLAALPPNTKISMPEIDLTAAWIVSGNRTHPNLKLVDELRRSVTYDGHEEDIDELERNHLDAEEYNFESNLFKINEKERMYYGDRSHSRLVKLDGIRDKLTYDGWKKDFKAAEQKHVDNDEYDFETSCRMLERKQAIHEGDYTNEDLKLWYSLQLSYPGWETDYHEAMINHKDGFNLGEMHMLRMSEKQKMHESDRSHPHLVSLDICSSFFNYPGWRKDVKEAEKFHLDLLSDTDTTSKFSSFLKCLVRKQRKHETGEEDLSTMHPIQRRIVETKWDYPGWEEDIEGISTLCYENLFESELEKCQLKQMMHNNDFGSHPALIRLDAMKLSYPGWEEDVEDAKTYLRENGYEIWKRQFDHKIEAMENKEHLYNINNEWEGEECCICMTNLCNSNGEGSIKKLRCGHLLHAKCLTDMIEHEGSVSHSNCPLCRVSFLGAFMDCLSMLHTNYSTQSSTKGSS